MTNTISRIIRSALYLFIMFSFSSCATLFLGTKQKISFDSTPDNTQVYVDGKNMLTTPGRVRIRKGKSHEIRMKKEGYRDYTFILMNRKYHGVMFLNYLNLGFGWYLDAVTGAGEVFTEDHINGTLILTPNKLANSVDLSVDKINVEIENKVVGQKIKKGSLKGQFFLSDVNINSSRLKKLVNSELETIGFNFNEDSSFKLKPSIMEVKHSQNEVKNGRFLSTSEVTVNWDLYEEDELIFSTKTEGKGLWPSTGNYSFELAFNNAMHKFVLNNDFYELLGAVQSEYYSK